jgi:hypothetical protein
MHTDQKRAEETERRGIAEGGGNGKLPAPTEASGKEMLLWIVGPLVTIGLIVAFVLIFLRADNAGAGLKQSLVDQPVRAACGTDIRTA